MGAAHHRSGLGSRDQSANSAGGALVGFDPATGEFFSQTDIPSGGGTVRHMVYYEPAGELWFGTDTNYIGRAAIH